MVTSPRDGVRITWYCPCTQFVNENCHPAGSLGLEVSRKQPASFTFSTSELGSFVINALTVNVSYYRVRRDLFSKFANAMGPSPGEATVEVDEETFVAVRTFLTTRNDGLNDNKRLSFDKALLDLRRLVRRATAESTPASN